MQHCVEIFFFLFPFVGRVPQLSFCRLLSSCHADQSQTRKHKPFFILFVDFFLFYFFLASFWVEIANDSAFQNIYSSLKWKITCCISTRNRLLRLSSPRWWFLMRHRQPSVTNAPWCTDAAIQALLTSTLPEIRAATVSAAAKIAL